MTTLKESWAPIPGYEGMYDASDLGRIRSLDRIDGGGRRWAGRILKQSGKGNKPYLKVTLSRGGKVETLPVHRLVLLAFHGEPGAGQLTRHLNGVPTDNRLVNLAWGTGAENNEDTIRHGRNRELRKTHCPAGHPYSGENLLVSGGHRYCRICGRQRVNARRAALRAAQVQGVGA